MNAFRNINHLLIVCYLLQTLEILMILFYKFVCCLFCVIFAAFGNSKIIDDLIFHCILHML